MIVKLLRNLAFGFILIGSINTVRAQVDPNSDTNLTEHQHKLRDRAISATQNYVNSINLYASAYGIDPALIKAVITVESDGNPNSLSGAGAMGLMQLMPETCVDYGVEQPYDPDSNIHGGTAMLANHFRRYKGDVQKVLAAYNSGIRHADNGSWVNIAETRKYVPTVLAYFEALKGSAEDVPAFSEPTNEPTLPQERNIDATPVIPYTDLMFQALRWAPSVPDPVGLAEDSKLDDAASALLTQAQAGRLRDSNLQKFAAKAVSSEHKKYSLVKAVYISTATLDEFQAKLNQEPKLVGNLIGLAHGLSSTGHIWILLIAR